MFDFDIWDKIENGIDYIFGKTSRGREKSEKKVKKTILSHWNLDHHHQLFSEMRLCVLYSFVVVVGLFHISCVFTQHTKQRLQIISIYWIGKNFSLFFSCQRIYYKSMKLYICLIQKIQKKPKKKIKRLCALFLYWKKSGMRINKTKKFSSLNAPPTLYIYPKHEEEEVEQE